MGSEREGRERADEIDRRLREILSSAEKAGLLITQVESPPREYYDFKRLAERVLGAILPTRLAILPCDADQLAAWRLLHVPARDGWSDLPDGTKAPVCMQDRHVWPCPIRRLIAMADPDGEPRDTTDDEVQEEIQP